MCETGKGGGGGEKSNLDKGTGVILSLCVLGWIIVCGHRRRPAGLVFTPCSKPPENLGTSSLWHPLHSPPYKNTHTNTNTLNRLLLSAHWFSLSVLSAHWLIVPQSVQLMALFLFSSCPDMKMPRPCVLCWTTGGICASVCYLCVCVGVWKLNPTCPRSPSLFKWLMELVYLVLLIITWANKGTAGSLLLIIR